MAWEPGSLVECVAPQWQQFSGVVFPRNKTIYTVRDAVDYGGGIGLLLVEIVNRPINSRHGFFEPIFCATGFRPIADDRLSIFRRLLAPLPSGREEAFVMAALHDAWQRPLPERRYGFDERGLCRAGREALPDRFDFIGKVLQKFGAYLPVRRNQAGKRDNQGGGGRTEIFRAQGSSPPGRDRR